jgi:hypothetical protein
MEEKCHLNIQHLPSKILKKVFCCFTILELEESIMHVCVLFFEISVKKSVLGNSIFSSLKLDHKFGFSHFLLMDKEERMNLLFTILSKPNSGSLNCMMNLLKKKKKKGKKKKGKKKKKIVPMKRDLNMTAYYTDGGVYNDCEDNFIDKIFAVGIENKQKMYIANRSKNVNIKAISSSKIKSRFQFMAKENYEMKVNPDSALSKMFFHLPIKSMIKKYERNFDQRFNILKSIHLFRRPAPFFLRRFVIFASMDDISIGEPIVRLFNSLKSQTVLEEMGFNLILNKKFTNCEIVEFDLSNHSEINRILKKQIGEDAELKSTYPIVYGSMGSRNSLILRLKNLIAFRYILIKLIDCRKEGKEGDYFSEQEKVKKHIPCYKMKCSGIEISFLRTTEE